MSILGFRSRAEHFERAVAEYERPIYLLCLRMMGNHEDAQDCAQEAMLNAYRAFDRYRGDKNIKSWLYRIAYNTCIDELRRRRGVVSLDVLREEGFDQADERMPQPEGAAEKEELRAQIRVAVDLLPAEQRAVVVMRDFQDMSYEEIAEALQLPEGTVKSRIKRAREKIKKVFEKMELSAVSTVQHSEGRQKR